MKKICKNCKFYRSYLSIKKDNQLSDYQKNSGECFLYPPKSEFVYFGDKSGINYINEIRPSVYEHTWCGQFEELNV